VCEAVEDMKYMQVAVFAHVAVHEWLCKPDLDCREGLRGYEKQLKVSVGTYGCADPAAVRVWRPSIGE
jgi:hypothetical protein